MMTNNHVQWQSNIFSIIQFLFGFVFHLRLHLPNFKTVWEEFKICPDKTLEFKENELFYHDSVSLSQDLR